MMCTRCDGTVYLNLHQIPEEDQKATNANNL